MNLVGLGDSGGFQGGYGKGFRWLQASGTAIGSYQNGIGMFAALRPVYPGGRNGLILSAFTRFRWHKANGELGANSGST